MRLRLSVLETLRQLEEILEQFVEREQSPVVMPVLHAHRAALAEIDAVAVRYWKRWRKDRRTGLLSYAACEEALHGQFQESRANATPLSLLLIDIDNAKAINTQYGFLAGNAVLSHVARTLQRRVRSVDELCSRYGGDELIWVAGIDGTTALDRAEQLRAEISDQPVETHWGVVPVSVSIGGACLLPSDEVPEDLLHRADAALRSAKRAGKNCTRFFDDGGSSFAAAV
jgi:diguanylate cyclase (GGDEF)-like protein